MFDDDYFNMKFFMLMASLVFGAILINNLIPNSDEEKKLATTGGYFKNKCQPIEININNGFFSVNTNRLKCGDVIINVGVTDYDNAIKAYELAKTSK